MSVGTYARAIDGVVETTELLDHEVYHVLHGLVVLHIHLECGGAIAFVRGVFFAFFGRLFGPFFIHVGEDDGAGSGFGKGEGGFFSNAPSRLQFAG